MNPIIVDQLESYIRTSLAESYSNPTINVFDKVIERCQLFYDRPAHSIREIKEKLNTKIKGDIFEHFALKYMLHVFGLSDVWLLRDLPQEYLDKLKMKRQDFGIDLVGRDKLGRWYAIQAKYRKPNKYKLKTVLGWKQLSTFYGIVHKTGPWFKHVIITNAHYVRHTGDKKTFKDKSICIGSLRGIKSDQWREMAQIRGYSLKECDNDINIESEWEDGNNIESDGEDEKNLVVDKTKIILQKPIRLKTRPDVEELRRRRLAFFGKFDDNGEEN